MAAEREVVVMGWMRGALTASALWLVGSGCLEEHDRVPRGPTRTRAETHVRERDAGSWSSDASDDSDGGEPAIVAKHSAGSAVAKRTSSADRSHAAAGAAS